MNIFRLNDIAFKHIALQKKMEFILLENTFLMYDTVKLKAVGKFILNGRLKKKHFDFVECIKLLRPCPL